MTRERWIQIAIALALCGLVVWSCLQRYDALAISPFPLGVDGFYYPVQIRSLLEHGSLQYPASPLTFWFMTPLAAATDPITGAKLGAAIGGALIALPAYGVGAMLGKHRGAGLVAAALATTSATSAFLSIEFVKQGFGLTVALAAVWLVLRALDTPTRARVIGALVAIGAAALAHKLAAGLVIAMAAPAAVQAARSRGVLRGRRLIYVVIGAFVLALVALLAGLVAPRRFVSPGDLALLGDLLTGDAHWGAPALARPGIELAFGHEAAIGGVLALLALCALGLRVGPALAPAERTVAWGFALLGVGIALPWLDVSDPQGLAFRLRVAAFVPLGVCAALVAGTLVRWLVPAHPEHAEPSSRTTLQRDLLLAAIAIVLALRAPGPTREGRVVPHPGLVAAVMAATTQVPAGKTVIVPERHILFMVAWYTRAPVSLRPDQVPHDQRVRLLPLHFTQLGSPLEAAIDRARIDPSVTEPPIALHPRHRNGLVLVTEATWEWLLAAVPPEVRQHWARWRTI